MSATKEAKETWEYILKNDYSSTMRLKVYGGWLVRYETWLGEQSSSLAMSFVPDPDHRWEL